MTRERGFTLLEVLVALVVLGFVVAGLGEGLRFGLRATERQERFAAEHGDIEAVDGLLRRLVTQMDPGTSRTPAKLVGNASAVAFTTDLGSAASALATTQADVRLAVEAGRLVLSWRPVLHAVRFTPAPPPERAVLLERVEGMSLSYWGAEDGQSPGWRGTWSQNTLPLMVRIRLMFPDGSGRHWPDIVAGPARVRPPS